MEKIFNKIENKIQLKEIAKKIFIIFMIFQPLLDVYMVLFDDKIQILGVSLATIFRFCIVAIITIFTMIYARKNKSTKFFIGYGILVCIYCIFHHITANKFTVNLNPTAVYNPLGEILYILRLCIPIALIYSIYNIKIEYKDIKKIVIGVVSIISLIILVSNLLKISYVSYSLDNNVIKDNMFSWFGEEKYNYYWKDLTSRGFFRSGNQLSGILVLLLPIMVYVAVKEKKIINWIILLMQLITMVNISTRVSVVGGIAVVLMMMAFIAFDRILKNIKGIDIQKILQKAKKQLKNFIPSILIISMTILIVYISPFNMRYKTGEMNLDMISNNEVINNVNLNNNIIENTEDDNPKERDEDKLEYIKANHSTSGVQPYYIIEKYPYTQDVEFWYDVLINVPYHKKSDNRGIRSLLMKRIYELNNNSMDKFFGTSFTRLSSFVWPERDYESQFYSLGICGILLFISPYFIILFFGAFMVLKNIKSDFNIKNITYIISLALILMIGYFSGHVMNEIFVLVFISFVAGIILNNGMEKVKSHNNKDDKCRKLNA